jgi:serine protease Do
MSNRSVFSFLERKGLFLLLLGILPIQAEDDLGGKIATEVRRVFEERRDATVRVEAYDRHGKLCGTGFFADPAGTIYTLAYIVANADEIYVVYGDRKIPAKLLVSDPRSGIALIKADCTSPFIPIGNAKKLSIASPLMTIGYPVNLDATPSFGVLGGFDRKFLGRYFMTTHLRVNLPVEPGFGGAPLLNFQGEAVGIIFSGLPGGGACYALPIEAAEKIRMDYVRFGEVRHGWVGVNVEEQDEAVEGSHVRIAELGPETPAAQSGLKDGDVLLKVGDIDISKAEDVIDASFFLTAGDRVAVVVVRDGREMTVDVRSINHPVTDSPLFPQNGMKELRALMPGPSPSPQNFKLE